MATPCVYVRKEGDVPFKEVDVYEGEQSISVSKQRNNLEEVLKPTSSFIREVQILMTPRSIDAINAGLPFDNASPFTREYEAIVTLKGQNILGGRGLLYLEDSTFLPSMGLYTVRGIFVSGRALWIREATAKLANTVDLGFHVKNPTVVQNSWDRRGENGVVYDDQYIGGHYLPIHNNQWRGTVATPAEVIFDDLHYHVYLINFFIRAFSELGWTITGDWIDTDEARGICQTYTEDVDHDSPTVLATAQHDVRTSVQEIIKDGTIFSPIPTELLLDVVSPMWDPTTGVWTPTFDMSIQATLPLGPVTELTTSVTGSLELVMESDTRGELEAQVVQVIALQTLAFNIHCVQKGEKIRFYFRDTDPNDPVVLQIPSLQFLIQSVTWDNQPVCAVRDVYGALTIRPTTTVAEMFEGMLQTRGVLAITNAYKREIELIPADDYYSFQVSENMSSMVDCSGQITEKHTVQVCRNRVFKFQDDSGDELLQTFKEQQSGREYGSRIVIKDTSSTACSKDFENSFYAPIFTERSTGPITPNGWWMHIHDRTESTDPPNWRIVPRIFYYYGLIPDLATNFPFHQWTIFNGAVQTLNQLPYGYFIDGLGWARAQGIETLNLSFANELTYEGGIRLFLEGVYDQRYNFMDRLLEVGRFINVPLAMNLQQVLELDDRKPKFFVTRELGNASFLLQSLDDWQQTTCKAVMRIGLLGPKCDSGECPGQELVSLTMAPVYGLGAVFPDTAQYTYTLNDSEFNVDTVVSAELAIMFGNNGDFVTGIPYTLGDVAAANVNLGWTAPHRRDRLEYTVIRIEVIYTDRKGRTCSVTECMVDIFDAGNPQMSVFRTQSSWCTNPSLSYPMNSEFCLDDFVEIDVTTPGSLATTFIDETIYSIVQFTVGDGLQPVWQGSWGATSLEYGQNGTEGPAPVFCDLVGVCTPVAIGAENNTDAFVRWFNEHFPAPDPNVPAGPFGASGVPIRFVQRGTSTIVQWDQATSWRLHIRATRNQVAGTLPSTDYLLWYDTNTGEFFYQSQPTGTPFDESNNTADQNECLTLTGPNFVADVIADPHPNPVLAAGGFLVANPGPLEDISDCPNPIVLQYIHRLLDAGNMQVDIDTTDADGNDVSLFAPAVGTYTVERTLITPCGAVSDTTTYVYSTGAPPIAFIQYTNQNPLQQNWDGTASFAGTCTPSTGLVYAWEFQPNGGGTPYVEGVDFLVNLGGVGQAVVNIQPITFSPTTPGYRGVLTVTEACGQHTDFFDVNFPP